MAGQKKTNKSAILKKWWAWAIIVAIVAGVVCAIAVLGQNSLFNEEKDRYSVLVNELDAQGEEFGSIHWIGLVLEVDPELTIAKYLPEDTGEKMASECVNRLIGDSNLGDTTSAPANNIEAYRERNSILEKKIVRSKDIISRINECRDIVELKYNEAAAVKLERDRQDAAKKAEEDARAMTLEKFNKMKIGMTLSQIKSMFAFDYYCELASETASGQSYSCQNTTGSAAEVMTLLFIDGKLYSKAQSGLY